MEPVMCTVLQAVAPDVRRTVRDMLPTVTVGRIITLEEQVDGTMVPERLIALLSGLFGAGSDAHSHRPVWSVGVHSWAPH